MFWRGGFSDQVQSPSLLQLEQKMPLAILLLSFQDSDLERNNFQTDLP